jgi:hypothetical protein
MKRLIALLIAVCAASVLLLALASMAWAPPSNPGPPPIKFEKAASISAQVEWGGSEGVTRRPTNTSDHNDTLFFELTGSTDFGFGLDPVPRGWC